MSDESEQMVPLREYAALYKKCRALTRENTALRDKLRHLSDTNEHMRRAAWDLVLWRPGDPTEEGRDETVAQAY